MLGVVVFGSGGEGLRGWSIRINGGGEDPLLYETADLKTWGGPVGVICGEAMGSGLCWVDECGGEVEAEVTCPTGRQVDGIGKVLEGREADSEEKSTKY